MSLGPALERLDKRVADHQDRSTHPMELQRGLAGVRRAMAEPRTRPVWWWAAAVVAALAVALTLTNWPDAMLSYSTVNGRKMTVGEWEDTAGGGRLRFSDGTELAAEGGTRWRVVQVTSHGGTIQLERGALSARVEPRADARWQLDVGPYRINVTGTRFSTSWDAVEEVFELTMDEGSVMLAGPVVGAEREVRAPEQIHVDVRERKLTASRPRADTPTAEPTSTSTGASTIAAPTASTIAAAPPTTSTSPPTLPTWMILAQRGMHAEAVAAMRWRDQASLLASESPAGLLLLSHSARLGGDHALASRALDALKTRFPDTVQGRTARFLSGKIYFDQERYARAAAELSAYLKSAPTGAFVDDAQVLQILALHASGSGDQARSLARAYLDKNPNGHRAARLRGILANKPAP